MNILENVLYKLLRKKDEINTEIIILQYKEQTDSLHKLAQTDNLNSDQYKLIDILTEQTDTTLKQLIAVHRSLKTSIEKNKSKGKKNIEKFEYLTTIAIQITNEYSEKFSDKLNENNCKHGVTATLQGEFLDHFMDIEEQKMASIKDEPDRKTAATNIEKALKILGFPTYKEAKEMKKNST